MIVGIGDMVFMRLCLSQWLAGTPCILVVMRNGERVIVDMGSDVGQVDIDNVTLM